jgi:hypothetical protein
VEVDLLSGSIPIGGAGIDDFGGARVVRVIANVLDKQVGVGTDFLLHDKRRFGDRIALHQVSFYGSTVLVGVGCHRLRIAEHFRCVITRRLRVGRRFGQRRTCAWFWSAFSWSPPFWLDARDHN